jgi:hypothetical protein
MKNSFRHFLRPAAAWPLCVFLSLLLLIPTNSLTWGFWAHKQVNRLAVFSLHPDVFGFFKKHITFITEHAVDPDKRRYAVKGEAECHYIDLDRYGEHPFDSVPRKWDDAVALFGEDSLRAHGILPWQIQFMTYRLTKAFREHNLSGILKNAADIGHYIGDAHVPLHCTRNYNGQLTDQHGIHGLWESRIPELLGEEWDYFGGSCRYIEDPLTEAWNILRVSFAAHDSVLKMEKELTLNFPANRKYSLEMKGGATVRTYSREFTNAYDKMMAGMVERRLKEAIDAVASFWYTAWVNAGQPDLERVFLHQSADSIEATSAAEQATWQDGKLNIRKHDDH